MEYVKCACGCGNYRPKFDAEGHERQYIAGHNQRVRSESQKKASINNLSKGRPDATWNKGKSYVFSKKTVYANRHTLSAALKRIYPDKCMICGWDKALCDVHHINPRKLGGVNTLDNAVILCPNCHRLAGLGLIETADLIQAVENSEKVGIFI